MKLFDAEGKLKAWWVPVAKESEAEFRGQQALAMREAPFHGAKRLEVLVLNDNDNVTGRFLIRATQGADERGDYAVNFGFNPEGGRLFGHLTGTHVPDEAGNFKYHLGIILDGELQSAPTINGPIHDHGQITGGHFTQESVDRYVQVLNAGALPATLTKEPLSEDFIGPSLGDDTIRMAGHALILSTVLVTGFMLVYYRFSGIMAVLALAMNCLLLMMFMLGIPEKVALSLPGLAGFALTIGMAVDSNVLIYERMREELDRGATLRMAIRNGFERAFSAIFDSHLTTLISAAVLFFIGEEQIKGFAVTLFLGVAINLYTAVFCVHVAFDVAERQGWVRKLKMMRIFTKANFDFWGLRYKAYTASILITVVGLAATFVRWEGITDVGMLNIDFTGGVSVQPVFKDPQKVDYVREKLEAERLPDLVVNDVQVASAGTEEGPGFRRQYLINISNPTAVEPNLYLREIQEKLNQAFPNQLETNRLEVSSIGSIEPTPTHPASKPETAKPGATKPLTPEPPTPKPEGTKASTQGRMDLPSDSLLASTDPAAVLLAQAAPPSAPPPAPSGEKGKPAAVSSSPAAAKPTSGIPAGKDATPPAGAAKTTAEKPASAPTNETSHAEKPADGVSPAAAPPAEPAVGEPGTVEANPRYFGGTRAHLHFERAINHDSLDQLIRDQIDAEATKLGVPAGTVQFQLENPKYTEDDPTSYNDWDLSLTLPKDKASVIFGAVQEKLRSMPYFASSSAIGSAVASETLTHALEAIIVSNILIMIYLWIRFQRLSYGVAAVVALIHDVFVALGFLAFSAWIGPFFDSIHLGFLKVVPFKIGMTEVAAFLTIVGYSVSDTVVVFDRIREVKGKAPEVTPTIINTSINQTLSRTILTSLTAWIVVVVLYFLGGPTIHGFSFAMIIGIITGTYSSIYVAAPLLLIHKPHIARAHEEAKALAGKGTGRS